MTSHTARRTARVIALASGKGGVGKTQLAVNLGVALAAMRRRTLLMDCDFGVANAAILLGLKPADTVEDVLAGRTALDAVTMTAPGGLMLIPGGSGSGDAPEPGRIERQRLADGFHGLADRLDYILTDCPSGVSRSTMTMISAADRVLLVLSPEPTAFMDAYATVKRLTLDYGCQAISVVANLVDGDVAARDLFRRFHDVAQRFLPADPLTYLGHVPRDAHFSDAALRKRPCLEAYPDGRASRAILRLAGALDALDLPATAGGDRFFGMEALDGVL